MHARSYDAGGFNEQISVKWKKNYFQLCTRASVLQIVLYKSETNACNFMLIKLEGYDTFEWLGI